MKVRTGFVSNSSSSSFVLVIKTEEYKAARKKTDAFTKEVLDYMEPKRFKLDGADLTVLTTDMGGGGDAKLDIVDYKSERPIIKHTAKEIEQGFEPEEEMGPFEAIDEFTRLLPKGSYFEHTGYN